MPLANWRLGLAACCLFIALAVCIIPYPGIESDEALFTSPMYHYADNNLQPSIFPRHPPLMVISYIGSLKTFLYWPILAVFRSNVWALRLPVVLLGAISIFVFFHLTSAPGGRMAAVLAAFLLATDPVFLLTDTIDWGPVALQHLLLVTGCWLLFRFGSLTPPEDVLRYLCLGFLCFGLALWNKAVFVWALSGLLAGALLVFWPEVRARLTLRNVACAAGSFLLGALPLIAYNLRHVNATLSGKARVDPDGLFTKWTHLERALNGSSLFDNLVSPESSPNPKAPVSLPGRAAVWIRQHLGEHRQTGFYYVFGALLLSVPWWWRSRTARFSLVFMATSWVAMASTHDAGGSAHHLVLLWPFPILFAAAALASLPWRSATIVAGVTMIGMNLLVVNQYIAQLATNGPAGSFTDAIFPLSASLPETSPETSNETIHALDWGISEPVTFLHQGRLHLLAEDTQSHPDPAEIHKMLAEAHALYVDHVPGQQLYPSLGKALDADAQASGYHKELLHTIPDSNGRPVFEVFRFVLN